MVAYLFNPSRDDVCEFQARRYLYKKKDLETVCGSGKGLRQAKLVRCMESLLWAARSEAYLAEVGRWPQIFSQIRAESWEKSRSDWFT